MSENEVAKPIPATMTIRERIVDDVVVLDIGGRVTIEAQESELSGLVRRRMAGGFKRFLVKPVKELGVTKAQSSRWQQVAAVDESKFEANIAACSETRRSAATIAGGLVQAGSVGQHNLPS